MSEKAAKNFRIINNVLKEQAQVVGELRERVILLEGTVATLRAEIANTKQMAAHLSGRGMGSTVHTDGG